MERYKPEAIAKRGWRNLISVADLLSSLPKDLRKLLRASRKGAIQVDITVRRLDHYVNSIDNAISRLTMGIVTAALIIGSSIIMTVTGGPELFGLPAFGFLGYTVCHDRRCLVTAFHLEKWAITVTNTYQPESLCSLPL